MLTLRSADLRLRLFASAIILSMVKALLVVILAAILISAIAPSHAPMEVDAQAESSLAQTPLSSIGKAEPVAPLLLAVEITNSNSALHVEPPPPDPTAASATFEPAGCSSPVEGYSPVQVGDRVLSARTLEMLRQARQIYAGPIDLTDRAIASIDHPSKLYPMPDPHHDRGVLDILVSHPYTDRVLYEEIEGVIGALRVAGFASWLRDVNELYPGSEIHIHAVAIGDKELSRQALDQLQGKYGYFAGRKGYFDAAGSADPHGGPIVCSWMREAGFGDLRDPQTTVAQSSLDWQERLRTTAQSFVTSSQEETHQIARVLGFQRYGSEDPSNMCGPLSAAILHRAGLLPSSVGPVADFHNYWLADPLTNGRPWSLFPSDQYQIHRFTQSIEQFDFWELPLQPGDFVYTYSGRGAFSHMFVVTEVDGDGRSYTVTNQEQPNGEYLIERVLLYDPLDLGAGVLRSTCENCGSWRRRTGLGGFDVLRRTELAVASPSISTYTVKAGDTLPTIATDYGITVDGILTANALSDPTFLSVGILLALSTDSDQDKSSISALTELAEHADAQLVAISNEITKIARPIFGDDHTASPLH
jgi:hypothetical protein